MAAIEHPIGTQLVAAWLFGCIELTCDMLQDNCIQGAQGAWEHLHPNVCTLYFGSYVI